MIWMASQDEMNQRDVNYYYLHSDCTQVLKHIVWHYKVMNAILGTGTEF